MHYITEYACISSNSGVAVMYRVSCTVCCRYIRYYRKWLLNVHYDTTLACGLGLLSLGLPVIHAVFFVLVHAILVYLLTKTYPRIVCSLLCALWAVASSFEDQLKRPIITGACRMYPSFGTRSSVPLRRYWAWNNRCDVQLQGGNAGMPFYGIIGVEPRY